MKSQKDMVLDYLKHNNGISHRIAEYEFGATRLADIIYKLRGEGYDIRTTTVKTKNRFGRPTEYAFYVLER